MPLKLDDIIYENGPAWVHRDAARTRYTVYWSGITHSIPDSSYPLTEDGLSLARARADYMAKHRTQP